MEPRGDVFERRGTPKIHIKTPDQHFEHLYDGYKLLFGSIWMGATLLLFVATVVELATSTPIEQTLDDTTIPTAIYIILAGAILIAQPIFVFFQYLTTGSSKKPKESVVDDMAVFSWLVNMALGFIQFAIVERGVFSYTIMLLLPGLFIWAVTVYFWTEGRINKGE